MSETPGIDIGKAVMAIPSSDQPKRYVTLEFSAANQTSPECSLCSSPICRDGRGNVEAAALWDGTGFCCLEYPRSESPNSDFDPRLRHVFHKWCLDGYLLDISPNQASSCPSQCVPLTLIPPLITEKSVVGFDVGGVIRCKKSSILVDNYLIAEPNPGAIDVMSYLVKRLGKDKVFVISKASEMVSYRTLEWFDHFRLYERTGIDPKHVVFCRERSYKAPICRRLGVTHFLDDHTEVLKHLASVTHRILFAPNTKELLEKARTCPHAHSVDDWNGVLSLLLGTKSDSKKG